MCTNASSLGNQSVPSRYVVKILFFVLQMHNSILVLLPYNLADARQTGGYVHYIGCLPLLCIWGGTCL